MYNGFLGLHTFLLNGVLYVSFAHALVSVGKHDSMTLHPQELLWELVDGLGGTHRQYQGIVVVSISAIYVVFLLVFIDIISPKPVLLGSLIGAFPVFVFEVNRYFRKPYLSVTERYAVKYPNKVYIFDPVESIKAENAVCVHGIIANQGRETAEEATVRVRADDLSNTQYHTRWQDENKVYRDIAPGERQQVHLLWINLETENFEAPSIDSSGLNREKQYPPGRYDRTARLEISNRPVHYEMVLRAKNMPERIVPLSEKTSAQSPKKIINQSEEWDATDSIKRNYKHFAILYELENDSELHVPRSVDLNDFEEFDEFEIPEHLTAEDAIERTHNIIWVDEIEED